MKRFLIPAVIVVDIEDHETEQQAENRAAAAQGVANEYSRKINSHTYCMLDDQLPNKPVPFEDEVPATYGPSPINTQLVSAFHAVKTQKLVDAINRLKEDLENNGEVFGSDEARIEFLENALK